MLLTWTNILIALHVLRSLWPLNVKRYIVKGQMKLFGGFLKCHLCFIMSITIDGFFWVKFLGNVFAKFPIFEGELSKIIIYIIFMEIINTKCDFEKAYSSPRIIIIEC